MQGTVTTAPAADSAPADRVISDAEYDYAFALVRHLKAAAADPTYRQAFLEVYAETISADLVPALNAAIDEILAKAADEAEFGDEPVGSAA